MRQAYSKSILRTNYFSSLSVILQYISWTHGHCFPEKNYIQLLQLQAEGHRHILRTF